MSLLQIAYLISAIFVGTLGVFICSKNKKSPVNLSLSAFAFSLATWLFCSVIALFQTSSDRILFWYRLSYSGIVFVPPTAYDFATRFLETKKFRFVRVAAYLISLIFLVAIWSGNLITGLHEYSWGYYPAVSSLHIYLVLDFILFLSGMYVVFLSGYFAERKSRTSGAHLDRIKYALLALFIGNCAAIDFLPNYGVGIFPLGFIFMTGMVATFSYAILAHQLLNIEIFIRRTAVFAGLFAFVYGAFTIITVLGQEFFRGSLGWNQWIAMIPTVAIITFALRPLETFLTNATERFLFQKKYDYKELLKVFTNEILTVIDLEKLTQDTVKSMIGIIKLESAAVLIHDKDAKTYKLMASQGVKSKEVVLAEAHLLVNFLKSTGEPLQKDKKVDQMDGDLKDTFKQLNSQVCLPIEHHDELIGILSLGMKKSGEAFTEEDLSILMSLARTEAIAISNARLFDELSKTQAEAAQREKMAVIGTLAAGINHEICNPLGIVRGQCEMFLLNLRDGFYGKKEVDEILKISSDIMNKVIKETDRATAITKKLSSFAKPSKRSDFEEVAVAHEVDEVIGLLGHDLKLNNIDIQKDFPDTFPLILADKKQVEEVLFNIIRNAAQAMDKKDGKIVVSGFQDNGTVIVRIADNGSGIPADKIEQIFHPFYTTKAPGKGTGLGLFIVKQVVERNRGTIAVESQLGVGTTFTLRFPTAVASIAHHGVQAP